MMMYLFHNYYAMVELVDFMQLSKLLTNKTFTQCYCKSRPIKTINKFYGTNHNIVIRMMSLYPKLSLVFDII